MANGMKDRSASSRSFLSFWLQCTFVISLALCMLISCERNVRSRHDETKIVEIDSLRAKVLTEVAWHRFESTHCDLGSAPGTPMNAWSSSGSSVRELSRDVLIPAFELSRNEVSQRLYGYYLSTQVGASTPQPAEWRSRSPDPDLSEFPVTGITLDDAARFASWIGVRLPTEDEWESVARSIGSSRLVLHSVGSHTENVGSDAILEIGGGRDLDGLFHVWGNVGEWVTSPHMKSEEIDMFRGFSCRDKLIDCMASVRHVRKKATKLPLVGFRLARDVSVGRSAVK